MSWTPGNADRRKYPAHCYDEVLAKIEGVSEQVKYVRHLLEGNGDPGKGMIVRVDRLEQREEGRTWHLRALWVAVLGALAKWLA